MKHNEPNPKPTAGGTPSNEPPNHRDVIACLLGRQPAQVVDVAVDLWERLAAGLVVIIGTEGFNALYDRSLHLAGEAYPWLTGEPQAGAHAR
ncbi:MAG: hypothetical protein KGZ67_15365, partial [Hydrogenophaga sp.]|nr:hypothetical protein [Hydrogenophaga sp.]